MTIVNKMKDSRALLCSMWMAALFLLGIFALPVIGQVRDSCIEVPPAAKTVFESYFNVPEVQWTVTKTLDFRADFICGGNPTTVIIDGYDHIISAVQDVQPSEIPAQVRLRARDLFPNHSMSVCRLAATPAAGVSYEIFMTNEDDSLTVVFDADTRELIKTYGNR